MIKLTKIDRSENENGTTITYAVNGSKTVLIQSRKRHIPHTNGIGTWDHTSYWVMVSGHDVKEKNTLKDAKEFAEGFV